jgi:hypothetical protein
VALGIYKYTQGEVVYLRIVEPESGPELSVDLQNWLQSHSVNEGVFVNSYSGDGVYELLLSDNRFLDKNLYLSTEINARLHDGELRINITDSNAVTENDVSYNKNAYLILKDKPTSIKVYVNDVLQDVIVEEGKNAIVE